jgi:hypothetical protein
MRVINSSVVGNIRREEGEFDRKVEDEGADKSSYQMNVSKIYEEEKEEGIVFEEEKGLKFQKSNDLQNFAENY